MTVDLIFIYNLTKWVRFAHLEIIVFSFEDRSPVLLVLGKGVLGLSQDNHSPPP